MSDKQEFDRRLQQVLRQIYGEGTGLASANRLSGGASQETWLLEVQGKNAPDTLILRRAPEGMETTEDSRALGLPSEAELIRKASDTGVAVPDVVHVLEPEEGLGEGFLMSRIEGETIARRILRDKEYAEARKSLPAQCGRALAGIHKIDGSDMPRLGLVSGLDQIDHYEATYLETGACRPIFDLAIVWLRENAPTQLEPVLVHGDFRLGNIMVDENGLAAVLDWELAHYGDPREDIGWMCTNSWRFGHSDKRLGGFGDVEPLLEAYAEAGGQEFTPKDIDWWDMLGSMKWGIMCMGMYETFRSGTDASVERAAIGRRVSETEMDLVNLLEGQRHA
jgi:aminoglycoside phosphotransferase (APT) family kinase protein